MKAVISQENKQSSENPHIKTLETKTIRSKSWPYALLNKRHAPAIALVVAGFFIGLVSVAQASNNNQIDDNPTNYSNIENDDMTQQDNPAPTESAPQPEPQSSTSTPASNSSESNSQSSHSSVNIQTEIKSNHNNDTKSSDTTIKVNGEEVQPDKNGKIKKDYRDENNNVRIRAQVNPDNNSSDSSASISISTNSSGGSP